MIRRQLISNESDSRQNSPRKTRSYRSSGVFQPTILYKNIVPHISNSWIGKKLIPWNGENIQSYIRARTLGNFPHLVSEFEIANACKSHSYRILYSKSKPSIETVPGRMNIFLDNNNIILKIAYF